MFLWISTPLLFFLFTGSCLIDIAARRGGGVWRCLRANKNEEQFESADNDDDNDGDNDDDDNDDTLPGCLQMVETPHRQLYSALTFLWPKTHASKQYYIFIEHGAIDISVKLDNKRHSLFRIP